MNVLILSDTHLQIGAKLPGQVLAAAERADHIVHAGDLSTLDVLTTLATYAPITAVSGNIEDEAVVASLPQRATVELGGVRIGVVHVGGERNGRHDRLASWFPDCHVAVYGHSHMPELTTTDRQLVINPGSPTQPRRAPFPSFVSMTIEGQAVVDAQLVEVVRAST